MTTAAATAQGLWNQGRRKTMTGAAIRSLTRAAMSGVAGHSISALRRPSLCSSSAISGTGALLESLAQAGQSARQTRLHGALGNVQRGRRLLAAELQQVPARTHAPVFFTELVEQADQEAVILRGDGRRLGGWGRIPRAEALRHSQLELVAAARGTSAVARLVGNDPQQPRPRLRTAAERR